MRGSAFRPLVERKGQHGPASLRTDNGQAHWALICELVDAGHALMLGRTQDGGAISFTVYVGEERLRSYAHSEEEVEEAFEGLRSVLKGG